MSKIVCKIQIGLQKQDVIVYGQKYSNKQTIEHHSLNFKEIPDFISNQSDIKEVYLSGPKSFIHKIEEDTKNKEIQKYSIIKTKFYYINEEKK